VEYNQISIKDPKTGKSIQYTFEEISWVRDMALQTQNLNADHVSMNQQELWIARLHESTGIEDTALRTMSRRIFETLMTKWLEINDVDRVAFLEPTMKE